MLFWGLAALGKRWLRTPTGASVLRALASPVASSSSRGIPVSDRNQLLSGINPARRFTSRYSSSVSITVTLGMRTV
jgi:hypothetical protein